jgi:hypothetical protein
VICTIIAGAKRHRLEPWAYLHDGGRKPGRRTETRTGRKPGRDSFVCQSNRWMESNPRIWVVASVADLLAFRWRPSGRTVRSNRRSFTVSRTHFSSLYGRPLSMFTRTRSESFVVKEAFTRAVQFAGRSTGQGDNNPLDEKTCIGRGRARMCVWPRCVFSQLSLWGYLDWRTRYILRRNRRNARSAEPKSHPKLSGCPVSPPGCWVSDFPTPYKFVPAAGDRFCPIEEDVVRGVLSRSDAV